MKKDTLKSVLKLVKPYKALVMLDLLCSLMIVAAALLIPVFSGRAIDCMLGNGEVKIEPILKNVIIIAAVAMAAAAAQYIAALTNNSLTFSVCRDLRTSLSAKLNSLPVSYLDSHPSGDLLSRMITDVDTIADGLLMGFTQLFTGVLTIAAILAIMFYLNPVIAASVALLTPASFLAARFIARRIHKYFGLQASLRGKQTALINELVGGSEVIKTFGAEERTQNDFDALNNKLNDAALKATFFSSLVNPSTRMINNLVYAVIALIGAMFAVAGSITVGGLSVFLSYAGQYAKPFNEISGVVAELQNALACSKRIFDVLEQKDRPKEVENPLCPPVNGEVELKDVAFSYSKERPLISDLSLKVDRGMRVAIVGPTGCGKTTLINLLMRFYDVDSGSILVDGADIREMRRGDLRSRYGMVLQDTWLCTGTVRDNIAYGNPDACDEEVEAAAKAAFAHSFIKRLPNGYNTVITGGGENLSAGQRQLLCIARAMLKLPQMLILDEATSSIDTRTEQKVQAAFSDMMKGRTSFVVAHRLSTIVNSDVILVMKDGKVIEKGNHRELLEKNGFYATLYNSQFSKS